jgi:hypothetical protein
MLAPARLLSVVLLLLALPGLATAADLPIEPAPPGKTAPPAKAAPSATPTQSAPPSAPVNASPLSPPTDACLEWSDGCRTCQRPAGGDITCSNVGIACVPKQNQCTRQ